MSNNKTINTIIATVATIVIVTLLLGLCLEIFGSGKVKPSNWFGNNVVENEDKGEDKDKVNEDNKTQNTGALLVSEIEKNPLLSLSYANVAEASEEADSYELTATIKPDDAICKIVEWTASWVNPNSEWASGKVITSYIDLSSSGVDNEHCTITLKEPFGEKIVITAYSLYNEDIKTQCYVDYLKRFESVDFNFNSCPEIGSLKMPFGKGIAFPLNSSFSEITYTPNLSIGTVSGNFEFTGYHFSFRKQDTEIAIKEQFGTAFGLDESEVEQIWNSDNIDFFDYTDNYISFDFYDFSTFFNVQNDEYVDWLNRFVYTYADEESMYGILTFDYKYSYGSKVFNGSFEFFKRIYFDKSSIGVPVSNITVDSNNVVL